MIQLRRLLICLFVLAGVSQYAVGQTKKLKFEVFVAEGDTAEMNGNYYGAHQGYKKALAIDRKNLAIVFKCAEACRKYQNYPAAEKWYKEVVKKDSGSYPLAAFWLAEAMKFNQKYSEAQASFQRYYDKNKATKDYFTKKAKHELLNCKSVGDSTKFQKKVKIFRMTSAVNSMNSELGSALPYDSVIFYSSVRPSKADSNVYYSSIFKATRPDTVWKKSEEVGIEINEPGTHNASLCFGSDGRTAYFARCELKGTYICRIFEAQYDERKGTFDNVKALPAAINAPKSSNTQPHVAITPQGQFLFFVSDRSGGAGQKDIWYTQILGKSKFGKVVNVGAKINTFGDEVSPFYDARDSVLFFSSEMHASLGGFDIFGSKGDLTKNLWSKPENLGYPVNSSYHDLYYTYDRDSAFAYLSSNRPGSIRFAENAYASDIYYYKLIKRQKDRLASLVPFSLYFDNDTPDPKVWDTVTKHTFATLYAPYMQRKTTYQDEFAAGISGDKKDYWKEVVGTFFDRDLTRGWKKLQLFVDLVDFLLHDGEDIIVTFKGYTSPLHSVTYNEALAKRRISAVSNYFLEYNNGALKPYLDRPMGTGKGTLIFKFVAIGKTTQENTFRINGEDIDMGGIEDRNNKRMAVYSPAAALQRKIEILAVKVDEENAAEIIGKMDEDIKKAMREKKKEDVPVDVLPEVDENGNPIEGTVQPEVEPTEILIPDAPVEEGTGN